MLVTATHINYFHICSRKLWLFSNGIQMEHTSDIVSEGKLIAESSYAQRSDRYTELAMDNIKIDFYDAKNKIIHETKKSDKMETAHEAQVKYYLYILEQNGVIGVKGLLEYPKLRQTKIVELTDEDRQSIPQWEKDIKSIVGMPFLPPTIQSKSCKKCSYYDFCYC